MAATVATLAPVAAMMTPSCAADFDQIATRAATGSQPDINTVEGITLIGVRSPDARLLVTGNSAVSDRTVTAASAALDPANPNRLAITLTATAEVSRPGFSGGSLVPLTIANGCNNPGMPNFSSNAGLRAVVSGTV